MSWLHCMCKKTKQFVTCHSDITDSKPDTMGKDWKAAHEYCRTQNDSLATIKGVQNNLSNLKRYFPIWSSVRGHFTPWIAYRGCFHIHSYLLFTPYMGKKTHYLLSETVGNCYFECKLNNENNGGCANNVNFYFGLRMSWCICLCDIFIKNQISESANCISCGTSLNDGECGEFNFISIYETMDIKLLDEHFGGFCLTCRPQSDSSINKSNLYSIDCNDNATGYCVLTNGENSSISPTISTFASYWRHCIQHTVYIIGTTSPTFCQRDSSVWTGLRKYKIDNSDINLDICYVIEIHQETTNYKERNCTENEYFLCKGEIGSNHYLSSPGNIKSTTNTVPLQLTTETSRPTTTFSVTSLTTMFIATPNSTIATSISSSPKSEGLTAAIIGTSIAGVVLLSVIFLIICLLQRRRRFQCRQSNQQQAKKAKVFHNTTYDDLVVTNQMQDITYANVTLENDKQRNSCNTDDIYVEKEEEYDYLHKSRQKKATMQADDDRYGNASYFEDGSYSTLGHDRNVNHALDNEYSLNSMPYSENQSSSVNSAEYDYCYQADQRKDW